MAIVSIQVLPLRWLRQPPADCWPEGERTPSEVEQFEATPERSSVIVALKVTAAEPVETSIDAGVTLSACSVGAVVSVPVGGGDGADAVTSKLASIPLSRSEVR